MAGSHFGYDGPCPPWNDSIVHRHHFPVCALRLEGCPAGDGIRGGDVLKAIDGHVRDRARITDTCCLNPDVPA